MTLANSRGLGMIQAGEAGGRMFLESRGPSHKV